MFMCPKCLDPFDTGDDLLLHLKSVHFMIESTESLGQPANGSNDTAPIEKPEPPSQDPEPPGPPSQEHELPIHKPEPPGPPPGLRIQKSEHHKPVIRWNAAKREWKHLPQPCRICRADLTSKSDLEQHMNLHKWGKPWTCLVCGRKLSSSQNLTLHSLRHCPEKPFKCDSCTKDFRTESQLTRHKMVHSSESYSQDLGPPGPPSQDLDPPGPPSQDSDPPGPPSQEPEPPGPPDQESNLPIQKFEHPKPVIHGNVVKPESEQVHPDLQLPQPCRICRANLTSKSDLEHHMNLHKSGKPWTCLVCGRKLSSYQNLTFHSFRHSPEKPFKCDTCAKGFCVEFQLTRHKMTHSKKEFKCDQPGCSYSFYIKSGLDVHMRTHTKPFKCNRCFKAFAHKPVRKRHQASCTGPSSDPEPSEPSQAAQLAIELTAKFDGQPKCEYCNREFKFQSRLVKHLRTHTREQPFSCDFCDKKFGTTSARMVHIRLHTGERPHKCETCGGRFLRLIDLKAHTRSVHIPQEMLKCEYCDREFARKQSLKIHRRSHT
eukprot:813958_1